MPSADTYAKRASTSEILKCVWYNLDELESKSRPTNCKAPRFAQIFSSESICVHLRVSVDPKPRLQVREIH